MKHVANGWMQRDMGLKEKITLDRLIDIYVIHFYPDDVDVGMRALEHRKEVLKEDVELCIARDDLELFEGFLATWPLHSYTRKKLELPPKFEEVLDDNL